ncbi:MAG: peptidoglycan DD-metalloendopeptidase family protein [Acidobacteriota bacterium]|jgi:murein DD-endopeptidase MepM/ murein hydrolase activator NlpD
MRLISHIKQDRTRLAAAVILGAIVVIGSGVLLATLTTPPGDAAQATLTGVTSPRLVPTLPPAWPMSLADRAVREVTGEFRRGDTFSSVLRRAGVPANLIETVVQSIRADFDVQKIRAGRPYKVFFNADDDLLLFRYRPDRQTAVLVAEGQEGWLAEEVVVPYDIRPRFVHADIRGSLEGAIAATWVSRSDAIGLARKLADIFAWDVDFAADLRVSDSLDVVVEQRFLEGEFVGFGDVLAAELHVKGGVFRAVRYERSNGLVSYFTPRGESLQRAFLRSPVNYSRISSGFSYQRKHPVLNVVRPHWGVDYVAPAGTPVHATAAGRVIYAGRTSQAGNHVKIRHGGSYTSWYLHLQGFASGLRVGDKVEQGQVIGYVGSTGLVTNTHLDYRLEIDGRFVDPLQIDFPASAPLPDEYMAEFGAQRDRWMSILRQGQANRPVVLAGSGE